jgi:shikimate 5-dehydrogenase
MDPDERLKPIYFDLKERDLIVNLTSIDLETQKKFSLAILKKDGIVVEMNAYDLDLLLGNIAAVANHTKDQKLKKKLDTLFDRVSDTLESEYPH